MDAKIKVLYCTSLESVWEIYYDGHFDPHQQTYGPVLNLDVPIVSDDLRMLLDQEDREDWLRSHAEGMFIALNLIEDYPELADNLAENFTGWRSMMCGDIVQIDVAEVSFQLLCLPTGWKIISPAVAPAERSATA